MATGYRQRLHGTLITYHHKGVLLRGPAGAGKSQLALKLLYDAPTRGFDAHLIADDQVLIWTEDGTLWGEAPESLAGLIEVYGLGIVPCAHRKSSTIDLIIDIDATALVRMPEPEQRTAHIVNVDVARLVVSAHSAAALPLILAALAIPPIQGPPLED